MGRRNKKKRSASLSKRGSSKRSSAAIGWFAYCGPNCLCDGDALIVAGSKEQIRIAAARTPGAWRIKQTSFAQILVGVRQGAAYALDEEAYGRFLAPGRQAGLALNEEDFSDPGPTGLHYVRIQIVSLPLFW